MRVFYGFDNLPVFRKPVVTLGSYDGVHAGHRVLLRRVTNIALANGGESVVITFHPHPRTVTDKNGARIKQINTLEEKLLLFEKIGIDNVIIAPFTEEFSRTPAEDFIITYLVGKVGVDTLVVGYNHHFGHNKTGDYGYLGKLNSQYGFNTYIQPREEVGHNKVSSTVIRDLIGSGEMDEAAELLAEPYFIIVHTDTDGAVKPIDADKLLPPKGSYSVLLTDGGRETNARAEITKDDSLVISGYDFEAGAEYIIRFCRERY